MPKKDAFTKPDADGFDFDSWLSTAKPPERSVTVYGRADLVAELEELEEQLQSANQSALNDDRLNGGNTPKAVAARISAVQGEMKSSAVTFRFRALSKATTKGFYDDAPKVKDEDGEAGPDMEWVATRWVAAASVQPKVTVAQVEQLREHIGEGQFVALWEAAFSATNQKRVSVPFSLAASLARDSEDSSSS